MNDEITSICESITNKGACVSLHLECSNWPTAAFWYQQRCRCSRHPDGSSSENYNAELEKVMLKEARNEQK